MSLETALAENTAALKELTAAVQAGNEARSAVLEAAQQATTKAKPATTKAKTEAPAETKTEAEPEAPKAAEQPAAEQPAAQLNECQKAVADYLGDTEGAEREARAAKVKEILGKVGVAKAGEVPEDKVAPFVRTFEKLKAQGNLVAADQPEDFA